MFLKSDLGRAEIKSQHLGILPREARTLLIMIDGKRNYRDYLDAFDNSKLFTDFGGVTPIFELLLELEYIEVDSTTFKANKSSQSQLISMSYTKNSDTTLDGKTPKGMITTGKKSIINIFKTKISDVHYETIKSDLAVYIEKNASPVEAWSYLLVLEQCEDSSQLLRLVQEIQDRSNGILSQGMNDFIKRI